MGNSASDDKLEGAADKAKGRIREAAGSLTGDDEQKAKGEGEQLKGAAKGKKGHLKDLVK
jgi:uncharacterized protein YjbJ (UPF0337 family)